MNKILKHSFNIVLIVVLGIFVSCADENPGPSWTPAQHSRYLTIDKNAFNFVAKPQTAQSVYVNSANTPWAFTDCASWITIAPSAGSNSETVSLKADENLSGDIARTSVFSFVSQATDYDYKQSVSVSQEHATPFITPTISSLAIPGATFSQNILISSNIAWKSTSSADWITCSAATDMSSVTLIATENATGNSRTATIALTGTQQIGTLATVTVTQAAAKIEEGDSTLIFSNTGGTYQFKIHSEATWSATTQQEWIQVLPNSGAAGETTLTISATPNTSVNERVGYVLFKIGTTQAIQIKVLQKGNYLETDVSQLDFTSFATSQTLTILSNTNWTIQSKPEWVTLSENSGTGNKQLTVSVSNNPNIAGRSGELVIEQPGTTLQRNVTIIQAGKTFNPPVFTTLSFSDKSSTDTIAFTTDGAWIATTPQSWITLTPTSGNGSGKVLVSVQENKSDDTRHGEVSITVGDVSRTALVQQQGKYFTVTSGITASLPSTGGTHNISFTTNDAWQATSASSWITLSSSSGTASATVAIKASDNPSINSRTDTTYITPINVQGIKVITTQAARYLKLNQSSVSFFALGGTSNAITITTDATYTISCSDTWFSVAQDGNTFTVSAQSYEGKIPREGVITIKMTGLVQGESYELQLPVIQYGEGAVFTIQQFGEDQNWNTAGPTSATFTLTGYGEEQNWNPAGGSSLTIKVVSYEPDEDWNF